MTLSFVGFAWLLGVLGPLEMNGLGYRTMNGGGGAFSEISCTLYASRVGYSW